MPAAGHLEGPAGLRVEAVQLGDVDVVHACTYHPDVRTGQASFLSTCDGRLVAHYRDIGEGAELVDLTDLHGPGEAAEGAC
ncbi:hypothetical protein [Actinomadura nitritigenes]|uniref:Uncharacterized protein n=1 Tax=Actinomadura nitritigenes TaxID=134602 RepID=A0ABS3RG12_9ACTN|nr:hypothetical protein [Actinomadura nitritigenes]MBO2444519.1 hypothetical protein [Actinomadura nitritigenes]